MSRNKVLFSRNLLTLRTCLVVFDPLDSIEIKIFGFSIPSYNEVAPNYKLLILFSLLMLLSLLTLLKQLQSKRAINFHAFTYYTYVSILYIFMAFRGK